VEEHAARPGQVPGDEGVQQPGGHPSLDDGATDPAFGGQVRDTAACLDHSPAQIALSAPALSHASLRDRWTRCGSPELWRDEKLDQRAVCCLTGSRRFPLIELERAFLGGKQGQLVSAPASATAGPRDLPSGTFRARAPQSRCPCDASQPRRQLRGAIVPGGYMQMRSSRAYAAAGLAMLSVAGGLTAVGSHAPATASQLSSTPASLAVATSTPTIALPPEPTPTPTSSDTATPITVEQSVRNALGDGEYYAVSGG
jgi:hypothetical protein